MITLAIGFALLVALMGAHLLGLRAGRLAALRDEKNKPELGAVGGALLGLLGLLLAFSFSSAAQRFLDRQELVVTEANALGTAWLRAGAFPAPQRDVLRARLVAYADSRVALGRVAADSRAISAAEQTSAALHPGIWDAGLAAVDAAPERVMLLLPALNDVIDLHTTRSAATHRHHQPPVLVLLGLATLVATALLGYSAGLGARRHPLFHSAFALLAAGVLWLTIDLDYPRTGLIRSNPQALVDARASMTP